MNEPMCVLDGGGSDGNCSMCSLTFDLMYKTDLVKREWTITWNKTK